MKKLTVFLVFAILVATLPIISHACSGTWYTCDNLAEFLVEVAKNCPDSGTMQIIDCDAGTFNLAYSIV